MDILQQLILLVDRVDRQNVYIPPPFANELRRHGFVPHHSYLRPPKPPPPPPRPQCPTITKKGKQCTNRCAVNHEACTVHSSMRYVASGEARCPAMIAGEQCKCKKFRHFPMCWSHAKKAGLLPPPPAECSICYSELSDDRVKTSCEHYFHGACFASWKQSRITSLRAVTCPMCRNPRPNPRPSLC
jgi:hypothetical protein